MSGTNSSINNTLKLSLKGLVTSTNSAITSTDRVIDAFGKLQAQITSVNTGTGKLSANQTWSGVNTFSAATNSFSNLLGIATVAPTHSFTLGSTSTGWTHYNTSDQTTNFERVRSAWSVNQYFTVLEAGGTGVVRSSALTATSNISSGSYILANDFLNTGQSGTAGYTARRISVFELSTGSGSKLLLDLGTNSAANGGGTHSSRFSVSNTGATGINAVPQPGFMLDVGGDAILRGVGGLSNFGGYNNLGSSTLFNTWNGSLTFSMSNVVAGRLFQTGNWFLGSSPVDSGFRLDISGTARVQNTLTVSSASGGTGTLAGLGSSTFSIQSNGSILLGASGFYYLRIDPNGTGVGTGNVANNASAILQADSISKGFLPPRQTQAQRTAISSPAVGLMVYQTDATEGLYVYSSLGWKLLNWV